MVTQAQNLSKNSLMADKSSSAALSQHNPNVLQPSDARQYTPMPQPRTPFWLIAPDEDAALNTAGVKELPVEIGSGFAVSKAVSPFAARGTPAASDFGKGDMDSLP